LLSYDFSGICRITSPAEWFFENGPLGPHVLFAPISKIPAYQGGISGGLPLKKPADA